MPDYLAACGGPVSGLRIGVDHAAVIDSVSSETAEMMTAALGAEIVPVTLPMPADAVTQWTVLCAIVAAVAHAASYPAQRGEYGPRLGGLLEMGHALSACEVCRAMQWRLVFNGAMARMMRAVDMVIVPVTAAPQPYLDNALGASTSDAENADLGDLLKFTAPADFTGYPALTLPGWFDLRGAPMGFQLMGPHLSEAALFRAGHAYQCVTNWHCRRPDLAPFTI